MRQERIDVGETINGSLFRKKFPFSASEKSVKELKVSIKEVSKTI